MNKTIPAFLLTVLAAGAASAAGPEAPAIFAPLKAKTGAWAEYSYEHKSEGKTKTKGLFRMSLVGKEGDSVWAEQKMTVSTPKPKHEEAGMVMKLLMGKDGVEKAYMKSSRGVMDMSSMMSAASRRKHAAFDKSQLTEIGAETVEVPAGKFKATHYTFKDAKAGGDVWLKPGVGPYGLIKQVHRAGDRVVDIELSASGEDAKSEVDEKTAMAGPPGLGEMMGRRGAKPEKSGDAAEKAPEMPSLGGMFKSALKRKAGLGE